jgi:hypothetical protein
MSEPSDKKPALPVPAGPVVTHRKTARPGKPSAEDSTYTAQVLGGGEKRGLKGGPETLERAKSTYLKSEYSGPNDRRPRPGRVTKTEI